MLIHEMMQQMALLSQGEYSRDNGTSSLTVTLPEGRKQVLYGKSEKRGEEDLGILYTFVGPVRGGIDCRHLLEVNSTLLHSRIAILEEDVVLLSVFNLIHTSINECAPMLRELAAVADQLEHQYYPEDVA